MQLSDFKENEFYIFSDGSYKILLQCIKIDKELYDKVIKNINSNETIGSLYPLAKIPGLLQYYRPLTNLEKIKYL